MENNKSLINQALAAELRAERGALDLTVEELSARADINKSTLMRILAGTRDINVTQLAKLSAALNVTSDALFRRAVDRMGGIDKLLPVNPPERDLGTSEGATNVHDMEDKRRQREASLGDGDIEKRQLIEDGKAALFDPSMDEDEHYD